MASSKGGVSSWPQWRGTISPSETADWATLSGPQVIYHGETSLANPISVDEQQPGGVQATRGARPSGGSPLTRSGQSVRSASFLLRLGWARKAVYLQERPRGEDAVDGVPDLSGLYVSGNGEARWDRHDSFLTCTS